MSEYVAKCVNCAMYQPVSERSGREWDHNTGYCTLKTLGGDMRKTHETNWCDNHTHKRVEVVATAVLSEEIFKSSRQLEIEEIMDAQLVEPEGLTFEYTRSMIKEHIADIRERLIMIEELVEDMASDQE